mgnify:CR=1
MNMYKSQFILNFRKLYFRKTNESLYNKEFRWQRQDRINFFSKKDLYL